MVRKSSRRVATLLIGLIGLMSPLLAVTTPAQAVPTPTIETVLATPDTGTVGTNQYAYEGAYRGYVKCSGGPTSWCWGSVFVKVTTGGCSNYSGCFWTPQGNYRVRYPATGSLTGEQWNCLFGLAVTGLTFYATGPSLLAVAGGVGTVWGCKYVG